MHSDWCLPKNETLLSFVCVCVLILNPHTPLHRSFALDYSCHNNSWVRFPSLHTSNFPKLFRACANWLKETISHVWTINYKSQTYWLAVLAVALSRKCRVICLSHVWFYVISTSKVDTKNVPLQLSKQSVKQVRINKLYSYTQCTIVK